MKRTITQEKSSLDNIVEASENIILDIRKKATEIIDALWGECSDRIDDDGFYALSVKCYSDYITVIDAIGKKDGKYVLRTSSLEGFDHDETSIDELSMEGIVNLANAFFEDVKEREDERIRKNCIHFLELQKQHHAATFEIEECITWLEKQGEHKPDDKAEPKFKVGDWVVDNNSRKVNQVIAVDETVDGFTLDDGTYFSGSWKDTYHLWTLEDAKAGDIIATPNQNIFIFLNIYYVTVYDYCGVYFGKFQDESCAVNGTMATELPSGFAPATKEQRDHLFQKMKEAGYGWDADKKELVKQSSDQPDDTL